MQWVSTGIFYLYGLGAAAGLLLMTVFLAAEMGGLTGNASGAHLVDELPPLVQQHPWVLLAGIGGFIMLVTTMAWPGNEQEVTASKLATFPLSSTALTRAMIPIMVLQSRTLLAVIITLGTMVAGCVAAVLTGQAAVIPAIIVGQALGVATILLASQALVVTAGSTGRTGREKFAMFGGLAFMALALVLQMLPRLTSGVANSLVIRVLTEILPWTPLSSGAAMMEDAARGQWVLLVAHGVLSVVYCWLFYRVWRWSVGLELVSAAASSTPKARVKSGDQFVARFLPKTVAGAMTTKTLHYWRRDLRYKFSLISLPVFVAFFTGWGVFTENIAMPIATIGLLFSGIAGLAANEFGFDGPSNWVYMTAGVRGKDIVASRVWTWGIFGGGLALLSVLVLVGYRGGALGVGDQIVVGCTLASAPIAIASSLLMQVLSPYPAPKPGANPMKATGGSKNMAALYVLLMEVVSMVPLAPGILLPLLGVTPAWVAVVWPVVVGVVLLVVAARWTARRIDQKYPEIFAKVRTFA